MVFLIQNTQNRDSQALHLKLDELLRAVQGARTSLIDLEDMSDEELQRLREDFARLHERAAGVVESAEDVVEDRQRERAGANGQR